MRIVHIVESFAAGTAHFISLLTRYTPSCNHVVVHGERTAEVRAEEVKAKFPAGVSFIPWHSVQRELNPIQDLKALIRLIKILRNLREVDVIHLHSSKAGFLGRVACFLMRRKNVIYTPHGASFSRIDISSFKRSLFIALEKVAASLSGQVVCCSRSESASFEMVGISPIYINNGTPIPREIPMREKTLHSETFTIVTCGRVTEQKNPALFNKIAAHFVQQEKIHFIWVGEGEADQKAFLSAPNICLTGWKTKQEVDALVSDADLYLSTSLWEGLPFSVLEALSLGKCLLLSDCVGNVDLVENGYNGFVYNSAEEAIMKIQWLMENREIIPAMEQNSYDWAISEFDIKLVAQKYLDLYRSML